MGKAVSLARTRALPTAIQRELQSGYTVPAWKSWEAGCCCDMERHQGIIENDTAFHGLLREVNCSHMVGGFHAGIPASSGLGERLRALVLSLTPDDAPWRMPQEPCGVAGGSCPKCSVWGCAATDEPPRSLGATGVITSVSASSL